MTRIAITVRHRDHPYVVRTFNFDAKLGPLMAALVDQDRALQHGDLVDVFFHPGTGIAVKIKGKRTTPR